MKHVAKDPRTGAVVREATGAEVVAFEAANSGRRRGGDQSVRVGAVVVDTFTGPGAWHGGAGF